MFLHIIYNLRKHHWVNILLWYFLLICFKLFALLKDPNLLLTEVKQCLWYFSSCVIASEPLIYFRHLLTQNSVDLSLRLSHALKCPNWDIMEILSPFSHMKQIKSCISIGIFFSLGLSETSRKQELAFSFNFLICSGHMQALSIWIVAYKNDGIWHYCH